MATATTRMTLGSLFGMVTTAANAVSNTLNAGVAGVEMLDTYVKDASERQKKRSAVDMAEFEDILIAEKAVERAERELQIKQFCAQSKEHAELFHSSREHIRNIIAERMGS